MRFRILLLGILAALLGPLAAFSSPQDEQAGVRLLNAGEGAGLVQIAWEEREQVRRKPDCSHLVHEVYELSGFPYPYASSYELYDGIDNFQRVTAPRAGDLIVWRGHVGIVFDPAGHTFYSSVRSGLRTEKYDTPYWKAQGRPRFYRYVLRGSALSAANVSAPGKNPNSRTVAAVVPVHEENSAESSMPAAPPAGVDAHGSSASASAPSGRPFSDRPPFNRTPALPSQIMVVAAENLPTTDEVGEAISEYASAAGNLLREWPSDDPTRVVIPRNIGTRDLSARSVLVYDRLTVEGLDLKSDRGWARVKVEERLSIDGQRLQATKRQEELRWEVRRTPQGWQLLAPSSHAYVPRDVAVHALANHLALLTQSDPASTGADRSLQQQTMIVRALGLLVAVD
jgi:hypothetical protein